MQETSESTLALYKRGDRFHRFGEYDAAKEALNAALHEDVSYSPAWNLLGIVNRDSGDLDRARECFKKAISYGSDWQEPLKNLGLMEFSLDDYIQTVKYLKRYFKLDGSDTEVLLILSRAAFELEECNTVLSVTSKILDLDDEIYQAWSMRGICQAKMDRFNAACTSLNMAIDLHEGAISSANTVGDLTYELKNYIRSVEFYELSLEGSPDQPVPLFRMGVSLWQLEKWADAIPYFEKYVSLVPEDPSGWNNLGVVLREKGEVKRAIECYNKALAIDPSLDIVKKNMETAVDMQIIL